MFWIIGSVVIVMLAGGLGGYLLRRREVGPKAAERELPRIVLTVLVLVTATVITVLIGPLFGFSVVPNLLIALMWIALGYSLWSKKKAGSLLLNLGRTKANNIWLFLAGLYMIIGIGDLVSLLLDSDAELTEVLSGLPMWLSLAVLFLFLGLSGLQIREAGIFFGGQLLKWERIESYTWEEKAITVIVTRRWSFFCSVNYAVPPVHRDAVNRLFAQHVSGATVIASEYLQAGQRDA